MAGWGLALQTFINVCHFLSLLDPMVLGQRRQLSLTNVAVWGAFCLGLWLFVGQPIALDVEPGLFEIILTGLTSVLAGGLKWSRDSRRSRWGHDWSGPTDDGLDPFGRGEFEPEP